MFIVHNLRTVGQFEKAAKLCSAIIGDDKVSKP